MEIIIGIMGACMALNAVALLLQGKAIRGIGKEIELIRAVQKIVYLDTSFLYGNKLMELRDAFIKAEEYETAKRIDDMIKKSMNEREEIMK